MILRILIGGITGAVLGFAWYKLAGCSGNACPLARNAFISTFCGTVAGALAAGSFH